MRASSGLKRRESMESIDSSVRVSCEVEEAGRFALRNGSRATGSIIVGARREKSKDMGDEGILVRPLFFEDASGM